MKFLMFRKNGIILRISMTILICFSMNSICFESYAGDTMPLMEEIQSPHDLARWLDSDFKYVFRLNDKWQTPSETINLKGGDCEDFATLASDVLKRLGIQSNIIIIKFRGMNLKHAICIWREKSGKYSYISNRKLVRTSKSTMEGALSVYYPDWESLTYASQEGQFLNLVSRR